MKAAKVRTDLESPKLLIPCPSFRTLQPASIESELRIRKAPSEGMHVERQIPAHADSPVKPTFSIAPGDIGAGRQTIAAPEWPNSTMGGGFRPVLASRFYRFAPWRTGRQLFVHFQGSIQVRVIELIGGTLERLALFESTKYVNPRRLSFSDGGFTLLSHAVSPGSGPGVQP